MDKLFRLESINQATRRLGGEVVLAVPLSTKLMGLFICICVAAITVFVSSATYARRETVAGWLTPEGGVVRAVAVRGGQIQEFYVSQGDVVVAGTAIARLRLSAFTEGGDSSAEILAAIELQARASERSAEAEISRLEHEIERVTAALAGMARERRELARQLEYQRERVRLAEAEAERAEVISARGYLSTRDLEMRYENMLVARQDLASLSRQITSLDRQIEDEQRRLDVMPILIEAAQADAETAAASLSERLRAAARDSHDIVRAPITAQIAAVPVRRGQPLGAGQTVAVLIPDGDELVVELYVPSRAAGFIEPGQEVRLMYQAFPHQRFGTGHGEVSRVSTTVLGPGEIAIPGLELAEPVFRVEVRLSDHTVSAYGQPIALQPGMLLSADIIIDRRTLIEWLFDPLFASGRRG